MEDESLSVLTANPSLCPGTSCGGEKHHVPTHLQALQTASHQTERNHLTGHVATGEGLIKHPKVENTTHRGFYSTILSALICETRFQETAVKNPDPDAENNDAAVETQRLLTSLKESMEQNEGLTSCCQFVLRLSVFLLVLNVFNSDRVGSQPIILLQCDDDFLPSGLLDDQLLVKVVKDKLMSNPCKNQGFVLDGFPKTYEQARELFSGETSSSLDHGCQCSLVELRHQNCPRSLFLQTNKNQKT